MYNSSSEAFFKLVVNYNTINHSYAINHPLPDPSIIRFTLIDISKQLTFLSTATDFTHPVFRTLDITALKRFPNLNPGSFNTTQVFAYMMHEMKPLITTGLFIFLPADTITIALNKISAMATVSSTEYSQFINTIQQCIEYNKWVLQSEFTLQKKLISPRAEFLLRATPAIEEVLKSSKHDANTLIERLQTLLNYQTHYIAMRKMDTTSANAFVENTLFNDVCELYAILRDVQLRMEELNYDAAWLMATYYNNTTVLSIRCKYENEDGLGVSNLNNMAYAISEFIRIMEHENTLVRSNQQVQQQTGQPTHLLTSALLQLAAFAKYNGIEPATVIARFNTATRENIVVEHLTDSEFDVEEQTDELTERMATSTLIESTAGKGRSVAK